MYLYLERRLALPVTAIIVFRLADGISLLRRSLWMLAGESWRWFGIRLACGYQAWYFKQNRYI